MIYTTATAHLWPRLIAAAKDADTALADALLGLMQKGATLTLQDNGRLKLAPGEMTEATYRETLGTPDRPKYPALRDAMARARTIPHPWTEPVEAAYDMLNGLSVGGDAELDAACKAGKDARVREVVPGLLSCHVKAAILAQALLYAGDEGHRAKAEHHAEHWRVLCQMATQAALFWTPDHACRVTTTDGRLWITDSKAAPVPEAQEGDLVLTDLELGPLLGPIEVMREAG